MKLLERARDGTAHLALETADDLWYLHTLLEPGDLVTGESEYKEKLGGSDEKARVARRKVWVALQVERHELAERLRVLGTVVDGSEEVPRGSHHGLDLAPGDRVRVRKEWLPHQEERLQEALRGSNLKTILVLFDRERAVFAVLQPNGYELLLDLHGDVPRKGLDEGKQHSFYGQIIKELQACMARYEVQHVIAASPSFWKEYLERELPKEMKAKVIFAPVSSAEPAAIPELLGRQEVQHALAGERSARELKLVDEMLLALAKDRLAYGVVDVTAAINDGNLGTLYVSEHALQQGRADGTAQDLEALMRQAGTIQARVHLLTTKEATVKLDGLGGIAGVKRW